MNDKSLVICIRKCSVQAVKDTLHESSFLTKLFSINDLMLSVDDYSQTFDYTRDFLKKNNLEDEDPFFNFFDMSLFNTLVDISCSRNFKHLNILEPISFELAQYLSKTLQTQCISFLEDMKIPSGLFSNGKLIDAFENYNKNFFETRNWRPAKTHSDADISIQ